MKLLITITIWFLLLEAANVATLYFFPGSKYANGVGVFNAWEKSKADPEIHNFVKYLVNWVAGTKLIFVLLLVVILLVADNNTLIYAIIGLIIAISSFFWRLFPLIRRMDQEGQIKPKNYSIVLGWMIGVFILAFAGAVIMLYLSRIY